MTQLHLSDTRSRRRRLVAFEMRLRGYTLDAVGVALGVSRERARQLANGGRAMAHRFERDLDGDAVEDALNVASGEIRRCEMPLHKLLAATKAAIRLRAALESIDFPGPSEAE